jgi:hypothetical protein
VERRTEEGVGWGGSEAVAPEGGCWLRGGSWCGRGGSGSERNRYGTMGALAWTVKGRNGVVVGICSGFEEVGLAVRDVS